MSGETAQRSWPWLGGLALLVLAMFADVLGPGTRVLGDPAADMMFHTLPWRTFGFGELARGNLALWNPWVYGGAPYFGGGQAALLYPSNLLFLLLPTSHAINWSIAVDCWLGGAFMFLWARRRGLVPFAAFVSAALFMFSAPFFHRIQAGLVTSLAAMAWMPLLFLCMDEWLASRKPRWCLVGMLAVAVQIFSGQSQYVYYTALIAGLYAGARLLEPRERRLQAAAGLLSVYAGGVLLAAVLLLPALQATAESVRGQALPYEFAASYSFPPESLISLLVPGFFGDIIRQPYWGRFFMEVAFLGVIGLFLALHGQGAANMDGKRALRVTVVAAIVLALGKYTPLYRLLYDWLPLFDRFRANARFMGLAVMLLTLFAGYGLDRILRERAVPARSLWVAGGIAALLAVATVVVRAIDWFPVFNAMMATMESFASGEVYGNPAGVLASQAFAALCTAVAACTLAIGTGVALCVRRAPRAAVLLGVLAVAEVFAFARLQRPAFDSTALPIHPDLPKLLPQPVDYRILNTFNHNGGIFIGVPDVWGYDPFVAQRYAELMRWSAGGDPARATQMMEWKRYHPLLTMVRLKYVVEIKNSVMTLTPGALPPLGHVELVGGYRVASGRDAVFKALDAPDFDPRRTVILEREPNPLPVQAASQGRAVIVRQSTDWLEIEAEASAPSILLVTDAWTPAWRARALEGSSATRYEVMPANYALRAIPLAAGKHRLRLEYSPVMFRLGSVVSAAAALAWLLAFFMQRKFRA